MYNEFIAVFLAPFIGLITLLFLIKSKTKNSEKIISYILLVFFSNLITTLGIVVIKQYDTLYFTSSIFYVKYAIVNMFISILLSVAYFLLNKYCDLKKILKKIKSCFCCKRTIIILIVVLGVIFGGYQIFLCTKNIKVDKSKNIIIIKRTNELIKFDFDTFNQELPTKKADGALNVNVSIEIGKEKTIAFGTIKVQGSSTQYWPKKNWSLELYNDEERTEELLLQVGNSIPSNTWILKADWIDPSMYRNGVSYMLWDEIVGCRNSKFLEVNESSIHNNGAKGSTRYYTTILTVNGEHYGITTLLLGHDPDNFNIDKTNAKHVYLEFDSRGGEYIYKTWKKFLKDGIGEWIEGYYPDEKIYTLEQKEAIGEFGEFLNSDLKSFKKEFNTYLNKENMIDMFLFIEFIYDWDAIAHDIEILTYDLKKWYFLPWDKDTTFGLWSDGSGLIKNSQTALVFNYEEENESQTPWFKTYKSFTKEIEARYKDLRNKGVFSKEMIERLIDNIDSKLTPAIRYEEAQKWTDRPSTNELDKEQMLTWVSERIEMLDEHFNYKKSNK